MEKFYDKYKLGYNSKGRKDVFETDILYKLEDRKERFNLLRRANGYTLTKSINTIPPAGYIHEADITAFWEEYRRIHDDESRKIRISFNTLILKLVAECLRAAPILNATMKFNPLSSTGVLKYKGQIDISVPFVFPDGRMLPLIVKDVGNKNLDEIAFAVSELERKLNNTIFDESLFDVSSKRMLGILLEGKVATAAATAINFLVGPNRVKFAPVKARLAYRKEMDKNDIVTADEIGEGTICVSDVGSIYNGRGMVTTSPVLPPTTACMAFSRVRDEQHVYKDEKGEVQIETRKILPFTVIFDHKVGGFPDVVPFLRRMDEIINNPEIIREW